MNGRISKCFAAVSILLWHTLAQASLIASWGADDATDESVANRDGTLVNGANFDTGKVGQAFRLDGANDYVSVGDDNVWTFGGDFTIALWANFDAINGGPSTALPNVLIGHDEGAGIQNKWAFFVDDAAPSGYANLGFHVNGPVSVFLASPTTFALDTGTWHHFAVTRIGSTYTFYVDGASLGTATSSVVLSNAAAPLTFGQGENLGYLDGRLDEIRLYDNALSAAQIEQLATIPEPTTAALLGLAALLSSVGRRPRAGSRAGCAKTTFA